MPMNARGLSLVETLVAFGVLSLAVLGTGAGLRALQDAREKTRIVEDAIEVEASLLRSLTQSSSYALPANQAAVTQMRAGNLPTSGLTFDLCPDRASGGTCVPDDMIVTGTTICFQRLTQPAQIRNCNFTPPSADTLEVTLSNVRSPNLASTFPSFTIDYSIKGNPAYGKVAMMGSDVLGTSADTSNLYSVQIPVEAYQSPSNTDCQPIPGYSLVVGVNGFDKTQNPYRVSCIRLSDTNPLQCPARTFPKSLSAIPIVGNPNNDLQLRMNCGNTARVINCPAGYALSSFDPQSMDPMEPAPVGSCLYKGTDTALGGTFTDTNGLIQGQFCPPNYRVDRTNSTCTIISGPTAVPGTCVNWVPTCTGCNFTATPPIDSCTYVQTNTPQAPTGVATAQFVWPANPDSSSTTCRLVTDPQACGARWQATIQLSVQCTLIPPPVVGAN